MAGARLEVGDRVQVFDLQLTPQYNGHLGEITKIIQDQQIATVRLDKPLSEFTKIKPAAAISSSCRRRRTEAAETEVAEAAETEAAEAAETEAAEAAETEAEAAEAGRGGARGVRGGGREAGQSPEAAGADEEAEAVVVDAVVVEEAEEELGDHWHPHPTRWLP